MLLVPACTFSTDLPGESTEPDDNDPNTPKPAVRCMGTGLSVCVDFEDMPLPQDGMTPALVITTTAVTQQDRLTEKAAELSVASRVVLADAAKLDLDTFSIEMWAKPTTVPADSGDKQVGLFEAQLQYAMNFESDRQFECQIWGTAGDDNVDSATIATVGVWHHVACTYDGAMLKIYVDGKLEGCKPTNRTLAIDGAGAAIGSNIAVGPVYKNPFVGQLDNVHLYSGALSSASICTLAGGVGCSSTCPTIDGGEDGPYGPYGDWRD